MDTDQLQAKNLTSQRMQRASSSNSRTRQANKTHQPERRRLVQAALCRHPLHLRYVRSPPRLLRLFQASRVCVVCLPSLRLLSGFLQRPKPSFSFRLIDGIVVLRTLCYVFSVSPSSACLSGIFTHQCSQTIYLHSQVEEPAPQRVQNTADVIHISRTCW
jgi:hypothetical protein